MTGKVKMRVKGEWGRRQLIPERPESAPGGTAIQEGRTGGTGLDCQPVRQNFSVGVSPDGGGLVHHGFGEGGTESNPPRWSGVHFTSRQRASHEPPSAPWVRNAPAA